MSVNVSTPDARILFGPQVHFIVPPYQRRYRWTEEAQWEPLWEDIKSLAAGQSAGMTLGPDDSHFLGALVLSQRPSGAGEPLLRDVIDGQQRLTTLQLLLDAAHQALKRVGHPRAEFLTDLILNPAMFEKTDKRYRFKLSPTHEDAPAFIATMRDGASDDAFQDHRIVQAHRYFDSAVGSWLTREESDDLRDDWHERGNALVDVLLNRLLFVQIDVTNNSMANSIFETLNARGTPLGGWDLVKNFVYEKARGFDDFDDWFEDNLLKFDDGWWQTESGAGRNSRSNVDLFLNHFIVLRTKTEVKGQTAADLYRRFRSYSNDDDEESERGIKGIGTDLSRIGDVYKDQLLEVPTNGILGRFLYRWRVEGHGVLTPVLLWLYSSDVPQDQLELSASVMDSYFGRRLICQEPSKDYRELSIGLLRELDVHGAKKAGDITRDYLIKRSDAVDTLRWPTDELVRETLRERPLYGKLTIPRVRMVLESIEYQLRKDQVGAPPFAMGSALTIEHLMPQKWETHWSFPSKAVADEATTERRNLLLHTLGNLSLMNAKLGAKIGNRSWADKKPEIVKNGKNIYLNDDVASRKVWNEDEIEARSEALASVVLRIWPGPDKF